MRITEKTKNGFYRLKTGQEIYGEENGIRLVQIVGEYEDIEDNKKCDLLILNEVSKTWKIYSTWLKDYMRVINIVLWEEATRPYMTCWYFDNKRKQHKKIIFIDQYKDTWALTREELE